jgi:hypothetical protein
MPAIISSLGESERSGIALMKQGLERNRGLTMNDRNKLLALVIKNDLPCEIFGGWFGRLSLRIYDHFDVPIPGEQPPLLIFVTEEDFLDFRDLGSRSNIVWLAFSLFVERRKNDQLLAFYGLEPRKPREDYY